MPINPLTKEQVLAKVKEDATRAVLDANWDLLMGFPIVILFDVIAIRSVNAANPSDFAHIASLHNQLHTHLLGCADAHLAQAFMDVLNGRKR